MTISDRKLKIYLVAGEPSGDALGARLMRAMKKKTNGNVEFFGLGGDLMAGEGIKPLFDISDLAIMGLAEIIPSIPKVLRHIKETVDDILRVRPDVVVTIDSWSFASRVQKALRKKKTGIPQVHYVAPQVWAWKKGRAKKISQFVDHLFCLLPGEEDYFKPHGMATTFIGHPVIEGGADKGDGAAFRARYGIASDATVLCVLPGSRKNEIKYLLPVFKESAELLQSYVPNLFVVIPTVATVADRIRKELASWPVPHIIVSGERERYDAFAAATVALAASGTVSLELAMAGVPHLIAYKVSPLTGAIARRLLKIRFVNLLNLLADQEIIPELLQEDCTVDNVVETLQQLLEHPEQATTESLKKLGLGDPHSPSDKLAEELQKIARQRKKE